jgi:hypothetical protein
MPTAAPIDDYRQSAVKKFCSLKKDISDFRFWRLGNSLDTVIDYLANIDSSHADDVGGNVITQCKKLIDAMGPKWPETWFDDYGWWVISTNRAAQQPFFSAGIRRQFAELSVECWKRFTENAPYTWDRRKPGTFNQYGPAISGGVWNGYWKGTSEDYPGPKDGDPKSGSLHGIQNTVTNALYLISAQRIGETAAAEREYQFLRAWLFPEQPIPEQRYPALWWLQNGNGALVRERVSVLAGVTPAPGFNENWAWTGDLGLILGVFVDRIVKGLDAASAIKHAEALLTGARLCLVDGGVLQFSTDRYTAPDGDTDDYATGTGVFWRYLLQAWKLNNPGLHDFLASNDYKNFVQTNANAALADATDPDVLSNQIAALVAGIVMLA